jgi:hypothetical protein
VENIVADRAAKRKEKGMKRKETDLPQCQNKCRVLGDAAINRDINGD